MERQSVREASTGPQLAGALSGCRVSETAAGGQCAFGYCRAGLAGRGRSLYCCDEHADAARSTQTVQARARRAVEDAYERIGRGEDEPLPHLGWLGTTNGVVLDGATVLELLALIDAHQVATGDLARLVSRPGATMKEASTHVDRRVRTVNQALLTRLRQVLTDQRPPRRP